MEQPYDIELKIKTVCKELVLQLRGNNGGDGNALVDRDLIEALHECLNIYEVTVCDDKMVSKEIVAILIYTCSRFYHQSKYSKNSDELLKEFDKLYGKLFDVFGLIDLHNGDESTAVEPL
ncbi:hypothetical protein [Paenibacillus sp.]|uniref:hypothetical protein n=1 Tax=Paenibacillus sp. TaxID=58172 RepID=UPI002D2712A0|nr:hypothetical protein [Paenibacillus sp.]HZG87882.1 hypothetical protein [Paenibacillus sp.]